MVSRCDGINYLGPGVKHRDDKFLSFLFCSLFKKKERCVILGPGPRATCRVGGCRPQDPGE